MAETGSFRTGIGGFNKADVLNYIDELNTRHSEELAEMGRELEEARAQLADGQQKLTDSDLALKQNAQQLSEALQRCEQQEERLAQTEELRQRLAVLDGIQEENQRLKEQLDGMRLLADSAAQSKAALEEEQSRCAEETARLKAHLADLEKQLEVEQEKRRSEGQASGSLRSENEELRRRLAGQSEQAAQKDQQIRELTEANRRYEDLVGDIGGFIVEIRSMGQRYLETSYAKAGGCLNTMEDALGMLEAQLAASRQSVDKARQELEENSAAAELRLEEWTRRLEQSAAAVTELAGGTPADSQSAAPEESPDEAHFFR